MRGYRLYNFPAFDEAQETLERQGWQVFSPAEMDRRRGFNEHQDIATPEFVRNALLNDLAVIAGECTHICLLPGWEESHGVEIELLFARLCGLQVFEIHPRFGPSHCSTSVSVDAFLRTREEAAALEGKPAAATPPSGEHRTIAAEADDITQGARNSDYGHPLNNFRHTAALWNANFGTSFTAEDVGLAMVLFKVSREQNKHKRDNLVDIAGYANCLQMAIERQEQEDIATDCLDEDNWPDFESGAVVDLKVFAPLVTS